MLHFYEVYSKHSVMQKRIQWTRSYQENQFALENIKT